MSKKRELSDLREAGYNPRIISKKRLDNLHTSMNTYGDLSGIVFNIHTKTLISGHQRLAGLRENAKTKIETKSVSDAFGTVAEGYVIAKTEAGILRIPYREVNWTDKKAEMAANIAANAHGGDFDQAKLTVLLDKLQVGKKFDVDLLGVDPLTVKKLMAASNVPTLRAGGDGMDDEDEDSAFPEYGEDSFKFDHECPKCKFQFNDASKKPAKPEPKAPKLSASVEKKKKVDGTKPKKKKEVESGKPKKKKAK